jgi:hypothetical protein
MGSQQDGAKEEKYAGRVKVRQTFTRVWCLQRSEGMTVRENYIDVAKLKRRTFMKLKKWIIPLIAGLFCWSCPVTFGEVFSFHDVAVDQFREYINETNWYWGKYSDFQGLGSSAGYSVYRLELAKGKIVGEKGLYYMALVRKSGPTNQIALLKLSIFDDGMRKSNEVRWFSSTEKAAAYVRERSAILVKQGVLNLQPAKPRYGRVSEAEKELKKLVVKTLAREGVGRYKLKKGRYKLYIKRMGVNDNYCTLLLKGPANTRFYTTFGNVSQYIGNLTYLKPELKLQWVKPIRPAEGYFTERVKRDSLAYTVIL